MFPSHDPSMFTRSPDVTQLAQQGLPVGVGGQIPQPEPPLTEEEQAQQVAGNI